MCCGRCRYAGNKWHAEEDVRRALVELQRQLAVRDMRLEQAVAGRQRHCVKFAGVPGGDDLAARCGARADRLQQVGNLVDMATVGGLPIAPLLAVNRAEVAILVSPFVPDAHLAVAQPADIGIAAQEPEQFDDDRSEMKLLGGEHRKALAQVESHLCAEHAARADSGPVVLDRAVIERTLHQVEILPHG